MIILFLFAFIVAAIASPQPLVQNLGDTSFGDYFEVPYVSHPNCSFYGTYSAYQSLDFEAPISTTYKISTLFERGFYGSGISIIYSYFDANNPCSNIITVCGEYYNYYGVSECAPVLSAGVYTIVFTSLSGYQGVFGVRIEYMEESIQSNIVSGYFYGPFSNTLGQYGCSIWNNSYWNPVFPFSVLSFNGADYPRISDIEILYSSMDYSRIFVAAIFSGNFQDLPPSSPQNPINPCLQSNLFLTLSLYGSQLAFEGLQFEPQNYTILTAITDAFNDTQPQAYSFDIYPSKVHESTGTWVPPSFSPCQYFSVDQVPYSAVSFIAQYPSYLIDTGNVVNNYVDTTAFVYYGDYTQIPPSSCNDYIVGSDIGDVGSLVVTDLVIGETYTIIISTYSHYSNNSFNYTLFLFTGIPHYINDNTTGPVIGNYTIPSSTSTGYNPTGYYTTGYTTYYYDWVDGTDDAPINHRFGTGKIVAIVMGGIVVIGVATTLIAVACANRKKGPVTQGYAPVPTLNNNNSPIVIVVPANSTNAVIQLQPTTNTALSQNNMSSKAAEIPDLIAPVYTQKQPESNIQDDYD